MLKVEGHSDLIRDPKTNSIVNTNSLEYEKYVARRKASTQNSDRVESIEQDLSNLKNEINEIKSLLKEIVINVK
ncbi:hypothetical protein CL649_00190 [bacterium]|nr:hypothetical protein [bacterium]|tara:strand:+ start:7584 stop:7805 length:222 start_codon:yes stop_codon:yes gene_type:complete